MQIGPSYLNLTGPVFNTYEVKKSLFHAALYPAETRQAALDVLADEKRKYSDARHHCWAYVLGNPSQPVNQGYNDDGEPSGTAGKPMLNVLNHGEYGNVVTIISRYFGGTKLGAGGLVRAYSQASKLVLDKAVGIPFILRITKKLTFNFNQEPWLRNQCQQLAIELDNFNYTQQVSCTASIPELDYTSFAALCQNQQILISDLK